jgi:hypothetical protein
MTNDHILTEDEIEQDNCYAVEQPATTKGIIMRTNTINKQAMKLAHLLGKINKVMTSKSKPFAYFLSIAYKMLRNSEHFAYVLRGLASINKAMLVDTRVSLSRFNTFGDCYMNLRLLAPDDVYTAVTW